MIECIWGFLEEGPPKNTINEVFLDASDSIIMVENSWRTQF